MSVEEELELELEKFELKGDDEEQKKHAEIHGEDFLEDTISVTTNSLLRATICELERALKDTRRLLFQRDKDNATLRQELEKTRKDINKEQAQRKRVVEGCEEKLKTYNEVQRRCEQFKTENEQLNVEMEKLKEKVKSLVREKGIEDDPEEIIPCCASMNELVQVKQRLKEVETQFREFRENNRHLNGGVAVVNKPLVSYEPPQAQVELATQLRLKFLRDAFFYYMIDFHPEEQMKAILAILDYDDKRKDIILESHEMRRQGKKFTCYARIQ
ncbi:predicted protein [Nematostella vectensis]|uniref:Uncharacterized protein n=1 Tax=Nematostella vectensis TaxID=45351 RepID=A7RQ74_NEMVE|nr:predicted protein [Nematostella vectensis]|eukprot:XP_001638574.1 predicted protein [Nematostella vectensis]